MSGDHESVSLAAHFGPRLPFPQLGKVVLGARVAFTVGRRLKRKISGTYQVGVPAVGQAEAW